MIVVDASAATLLFLDSRLDPRVHRARTLLGEDPAWLVPEHWRTEVCSALRGLDLGGKLRDPGRTIRLLADLTVATVPTTDLVPRMWQLRHHLSAGLALVTGHARIARSGVGRCPIVLIEP